MAGTRVFEKVGTFQTGCNYWASHAGTAMWSDWRPEVVKKDLRQLAGAGLKVLRVFPLWPDFQPVDCLKGYAGSRVEMRFGEEPLGDDDVARAGVSAEMLGRFEFLADEAERNGLSLIVGLVTGWMSGRMFVPRAFENLNVLTDPFVIRWQVKFVKCFVGRFKGHKAVAAWDLGNECNCMGAVPDSDSASLWSSSIANAIKSVDDSRPVVSGMHGLKVSSQASWTIADQAEITDILTTHPYPLFTPWCNLDPINTMRNGLHASAESRLCSDVGARPCMVEEIGTLGSMICSEKAAADYVRTTLFSSFANDCRAFLWWCAYDQDHLAAAPYDWNSVERELGLFRKDRSPKPLVAVFEEFAKLLEKLPSLPGRKKEAVCILTEGQDNWAVAFGSFMLARQAGYDIEFQSASQPLRKSSLYLMPSVAGGSPLSRERWLELLDEVRRGAGLYISLGSGILSPFGEAVGVEVQTRSKRTSPAEFSIDGVKASFASKSPDVMALKAVSAKVIGSEKDGTPCFFENKLGKGRIWLLTFPVEQELAESPGALCSKDAAPVWRIHEVFAGEFTEDRAVRKDNPFVGVTEHPRGPGERVIFAINYSPDEAVSDFVLGKGWKLGECVYGAGPKPSKGGLNVAIPPNGSVIFTVTKNGR